MSGAFGTIRGFLHRAPELKKSKSGNDYSMATLKVKDGNETKFWRVMAFKDCAQRLMQFGEGDAASAEGSIKIDTYEKDGTTRIGYTLMANDVEPYFPKTDKRSEVRI